MKAAGHLLSAVVMAVLADHSGALPLPAAIDGSIIKIAAPAAPKSGGGRIAGAAKKDGVVSGTGRRAAGSRIGGK